MKEWIQKNRWFCLSLLVYFPLFKPDSISILAQFSAINQLYILGKYLSIIIIVIVLLKNIKLLKITPFFCLICVLLITFSVSTALNGKNIVDNVMPSWLNIFIGILFLGIALQTKNIQQVLRAIRAILVLLLVLNVLFIFIYPHGMYFDDELSVFLGQKNTVRNYALPALLFSFVLDFICGTKISKFTIVIAAMSVASQLLVYSATGLVVTAAFIVLSILVFQHRRPNPSVLVYGSLLLNVFVVFIKLPLLDSFIENVLYKDSSFTGRSVIWEVSIELIKSNPLFGLGCGNDSLLLLVGSAANSSHNALLNFAYMGGLVALSVFLIIMIFMALQLQRKSSSGIASLCALCAALFIVSGVFENICYLGAFLVFQLACNVNLLIDEKHGAVS